MTETCCLIPKTYGWYRDFRPWVTPNTPFVLIWVSILSTSPPHCTLCFYWSHLLRVEVRVLDCSNLSLYYKYLLFSIHLVLVLLWIWLR